jgi:hypothetical protein
VGKLIAWVIVGWTDVDSSKVVDCTTIGVVLGSIVDVGIVLSSIEVKELVTSVLCIVVSESELVACIFVVEELAAETGFCTKGSWTAPGGGSLPGKSTYIFPLAKAENGRLSLNIS